MIIYQERIFRHVLSGGYKDQDNCPLPLSEYEDEKLRSYLQEVFQNSYDNLKRQHGKEIDKYFFWSVEEVISKKEIEDCNVDILEIKATDLQRIYAWTFNREIIFADRCRFVITEAIANLFEIQPPEWEDDKRTESFYKIIIRLKFSPVVILPANTTTERKLFR